MDDSLGVDIFESPRNLGKIIPDFDGNEALPISKELLHILGSWACLPRRDRARGRHRNAWRPRSGGAPALRSGGRARSGHASAFLAAVSGPCLPPPFPCPTGTSCCRCTPAPAPPSRSLLPSKPRTCRFFKCHRKRQSGHEKGFRLFKRRRG